MRASLSTVASAAPRVVELPQAWAAPVGRPRLRIPRLAARLIHDAAAGVAVLAFVTLVITLAERLG